MAAPPLDLPSELTAGQARLVSGLVADWQLSVDGPPTHGASALILLVLTAAGRPAVLKLGGPGDEPDHEHLALQHWHGSGAVELLRADPRRRALLLERLHAADVGRLADAEACEVVAGLYRRLHIRSVPHCARSPP